jgi:hypothetical protein
MDDELSKAYRDAACEQFLEEHPGLYDALVQAPKDEILFDLLCKFQDHGQLSPAQVALALLVGNEKHIDAPTGRVKLCGTIISVKARKDDEASMVMTVLVVTPDGSWLAWGSVPKKLRGDKTLNEVREALRCSDVQFIATVEHGTNREAFWGYYRNPRAVRVVVGGKVIEESGGGKRVKRQRRSSSPAPTHE